MVSSLELKLDSWGILLPVVTSSVDVMGKCFSSWRLRWRRRHGATPCTSCWTWCRSSCPASCGSAKAVRIGCTKSYLVLLNFMFLVGHFSFYLFFSLSLCLSICVSLSHTLSHALSLVSRSTYYSVVLRATLFLQSIQIINQNCLIYLSLY